MHQDIKLKFPIEVAGATVSSVRMRRPKVSDMMAADRAKGSDAEKEVNLFANLCELAPSDIGNLDIKDYEQLKKVFAGFLS